MEIVGVRRAFGVVCSLVLAVTAVATAAPATSATDGGPVNGELPWHQQVLDHDGKLLAWYQPQDNLGYDKVLRLGWQFIEEQVQRDTKGGTGLPVYLVNSVFDPTSGQGVYFQHNPAMLYGSFVDSVLAWYPYSADREAVHTVRTMLDYMLLRGTTPATWEWARVPFATSCGNVRDYGGCLSDMPHDFAQGIEPDKVGELGIGYAEFYELTGDRRYLDAGIRAANALAAHVRAGDDDHTPWPFRLNGKSGAVLAGEEYGGAVVSPLRLFDELVRLHAGDVASYRRAHDTAWRWVLEHPLNPRSRAYDKWSGYFEDIPKSTANLNQALPTYTALYLLSRPDPDKLDTAWAAHVRHLIDWVLQHLGRGPFDGAWGIDEQGPAIACCSPAGLGSDTSRWGAVNAIYSERTGDRQAREDAFRSLNYATYFASSDGKISCCGTALDGLQYWFTDGYSDYLRHFNWSMGAIPDLAPMGQDHLLRSSSAVQHVAYGPHRVSYRTFDEAATEVLRLHFRPTRIRSGRTVLRRRADLSGDDGGYTVQTLSGGDYLVRVRHTEAREVTISGA